MNLGRTKEAAMERRKIANEAEARRALSAVAGAKVGIGSWAQAHGIDGRSLHAWDLTLNRKARPQTVARRNPTAGLVELVPTAVRALQARYIMRVGAVSFEFGDFTDLGVSGLKAEKIADAWLVVSPAELESPAKLET